MVTDEFRRTITATYGQAGAAWLDRLPAIIQRCAELWDLKVLPPFDKFSYSYPAPAVRADGTEVVLKLSLCP